MQISTECIPCLMKRVLFQSRLVENGTEFNSMASALRAYADACVEGANSAEVATKVHRASYDAMLVADPYLDLKIKADQVAEKYIEESTKYVEDSDDRIRAAMRVAIVGNIMDFGSGIAIDNPEDFNNVFHRLLNQDMGRDDTEAIKEKLSKSKNILYLFDNSGESQLDKVLIRELRDMGKRVVGVVRGEPILNDVTRDDAIRSGLDKELDLLLDNGAFAIGLDINKIGEELKNEWEQADMIFAKGMANYEALSDVELKIPLVYLMRIKCNPISKATGVPLDTSALMLRLP